MEREDSTNSRKRLDLNVEWDVEGGVGDSDLERNRDDRKLKLSLCPPAEHISGMPRRSDGNSCLIDINKLPKKERTSQYLGVMRHIRRGKYVAQIWDGSYRKEGKIKKGRQVYLGAYDEEDKAAKAYDLAALKYYGPTTKTNFPLSIYEKELDEMKNMKKEECVATLLRKCSGFSKGASEYRGVRRSGERWQARIRIPNKYLTLGTFGTQEEAAKAYDIAALKYKGISAVTNFPVSNYNVEHICSSSTLTGDDIGKLPSPQNSSLYVAAIENESVSCGT